MPLIHKNNNNCDVWAWEERERGECVYERGGKRDKERVIETKLDDLMIQKKSLRP